MDERIIFGLYQSGVCVWVAVVWVVCVWVEMGLEQGLEW